MTSTASRIKGAILGQFVGDALCLGSHWHYDLEKRDNEVYPKGITGFERPVAGHYHAGREPGAPTHYGDGAMVLLRSIVEAGGFDADAYGRAYVKAFGPGYGGYVDKATKGTLERFPTTGRGADDAQTGSMSRLAPVVVVTPAEHLDAVIEDAVRICQDNDVAVAFNQAYARILGGLLESRPLAEVIDSTGVPGEALAQAKAALGATVIEATGQFGRACNLVQTFPSCLHAALKYGRSFSTALLESARAGGDNAARCSVLGAWLGALHGVEGIPPVWLDMLKNRREVEALIARLPV